MRIKLISKENLVKLSSYDIIAVTGPMAAGKNYICKQLEKYDFVSIDADKTVHQAIKIATPKILATFEQSAKKAGINLQFEDGSLNRRALGSLVFGNRELLAKQESIVYPIILKMIDDFIEAHPDKRIIINATVLYKTPVLMEKCQMILYVTASLFTRLKRAKKRDNLSYKEILKRFLNQKNLLQEYENTGKEILIVRNNKNS